jgi:hypothetical protein
MAGLGEMTQPVMPEDAEPEGNVTPEEQAMYEQVVNNALEIMYPANEDALAPTIAAALAGSDNPIMNLATTAVSVAKGLVDSAKKAGTKIPGEILYHAGVAIVEELAEAAEAFKIHVYSEEDIEQAFYQALDMFRSAGMETGDVDGEVLKSEFEQIKQADAEGRLGEVLPGIEERMAQQPEQQGAV